MQNQKYLLPVGFYDLLGSEAKINQETIDILLNTFYGKGYQLIKTPLVEFEDSLRDNQKIDDQSFKMVDSFSGKTLLIRSDITPQIARLIATKLKDVAKPIRLCYAGDVLKIKNDDLYADRQLTQVGIEMIGFNAHQSSLEASLEASLEVIALTLSALKKIELSSLMINFCWPQFLDILLLELKIDHHQQLKEIIAKKNISALKQQGKEYAEVLINLCIQNNDLTQIRDIIANLPISVNTKNQLEKWQKIIKDIKNNHPEIKVSLDIFGDEEFLYHHQIGFTIFADNFSYPIARGGCYKINEEWDAVGATIYINNLRKILVK